MIDSSAVVSRSTELEKQLDQSHGQNEIDPMAQTDRVTVSDAELELSPNPEFISNSMLTNKLTNNKI